MYKKIILGGKEEKGHIQVSPKTAGETVLSIYLKYVILTNL